MTLTYISDSTKCFFPMTFTIYHALFIQCLKKQFYYRFIHATHSSFYEHSKNDLHCEKTCLGFPTRADTNGAVQKQKMVRGLKFWTWEIEGLYYLCSENKHCYRKADLHLNFCICKKQVFS